MRHPGMVVLLVCAGCAHTDDGQRADSSALPGSVATSTDGPRVLDLVPATGTDPDGVDAPVAPDAFGPRLASLATAERARFVALPAPPDTAHPMVCDLVAFAGGLYVSHVRSPLTRTGARIHRLRAPGPDGAKAGPRDLERSRWDLVLDWDRGGRPGDPYARGGEGFLRLRVLDGSIFAPDADSPGPESFGVTDAWVENLVLRSLPDGTFPALEDRPRGSLIQPWSYHSFDIIAYHGRWVLSGGLAFRHPELRGYPAGLWVLSPGEDVAELRHLFASGHGVARATYMHRFAGRLYVGLQNNQKQLPHDLAVVSRDPADPDTRVELVSLAPGRGRVTRSMVSTEGAFYWLGEAYQRGPGLLVRSRDGVRFERVPLPEDAGAPQDMVIAPGGARFLLTRRGLFRSPGPDDRFTLLAEAPESDPFGRRNSFCGARLIAFGDALVAGSLRDGTLYQIVASH